MNKVCILGSMNMDLVIRTEDMPKEGETVLAKGFEKIAGGKGANQAVAAKRCGNTVSMISKIGKDENGKILKDLLDKEGINVDYVFTDEIDETGMAIITVNDRGNNSITVVAGANMKINEKEIDEVECEIIKNDILISQFETPEDMTIKAFKKAKEYGKITILNPAPAKEIKDELLKYVDIIIPNETEAELLTGIKIESLDDVKKAGNIFNEKGVKYVIITLGANGAAIVSGEKIEVVEAFKVNAIDTTAAGDSFIGGLSSKLNKDELTYENLLKAVEFGNKVSSITVQRKGAQPSIATLEEVIKLYGKGL